MTNIERLRGFINLGDNGNIKINACNALLDGIEAEIFNLNLLNSRQRNRNIKIFQQKKDLEIAVRECAIELLEIKCRARSVLEKESIKKILGFD